MFRGAQHDTSTMYATKLSDGDTLAFYSHGFGTLVKGRADVIVRDGECDFPVMRRNHLPTHDLDEDMRLSIHTDDLSSIRVARVERSGDISFIKK